MPIKRFPTDVTASQIRSLSLVPPTEVVAEIVEAVRSRGDAAVAELEQRFDGTDDPRRVSSETILQARDSIDDDLRAAIELAINNVRQVAEGQLAANGDHIDGPIVADQGQSVEYRHIPVDRAGAYVPGGNGSYPSTAIMCLTAARAAGVRSVAVASPVREDGNVDPAVLAVCAMLDVDEVYPIGGAQAVAALALGTEAIDAVDVIVGPGNAFVQEAKRQLVGHVAIDGVAGPSELVVVADGSADANAVSLDLLAQAEHGPDSLVVLISPEPDLLDAVADRCGDIPAEMAIVLASDMESAVALADAIAPEHLQINADPGLSERLSARVRNAGCLFVGENAATAFGDYVVGSNHVLPTGGAARFTSGLSPSTFTRRMAVVSIPDEAVDELSEAGATIARAEGFPMHAESMEARRKPKT
ncbi:MAG: histidinol dehydrogenase [Solirubrobacterales bacterium]